VRGARRREWRVRRRGDDDDDDDDGARNDWRTDAARGDATSRVRVAHA
jgi:hypothetical protein